MSLLDYLARCNPALDKKIIDIALSRAAVPVDLRPDAAQEIRLQWASQKPDTKRFKPGQIASYAHRMAIHAALRTRREIGSSVRLPGSAFRKRKDGSSYVTPGVLAAPLSWEDLEGWLDADRLADGGSHSGHAGIGLNALEFCVAPEEAEESEEELTRQRTALLEAHRPQLKPLQIAIVTGLLAGQTYEALGQQLDIKRGQLLKELAVVAEVVGRP